MTATKKAAAASRSRNAKRPRAKASGATGTAKLAKLGALDSASSSVVITKKMKAAAKQAERAAAKLAKAKAAAEKKEAKRLAREKKAEAARLAKAAKAKAAMEAKAAKEKLKAKRKAEREQKKSRKRKATGKGRGGRKAASESGNIPQLDSNMIQSTPSGFKRYAAFSAGKGDSSEYADLLASMQFSPTTPMGLGSFGGTGQYLLPFPTPNASTSSDANAAAGLAAAAGIAAAAVSKASTSTTSSGYSNLMVVGTGISPSQKELLKEFSGAPASMSKAGSSGNIRYPQTPFTGEEVLGVKGGILGMSGQENRPPSATPFSPPFELLTLDGLLPMPFSPSQSGRRRHSFSPVALNSLEPLSPTEFPRRSWIVREYK